MNISDRTTTNAIRATYSTLGLKLPKPIAEAYARAEKLARAHDARRARGTRADHG